MADRRKEFVLEAMDRFGLRAYGALGLEYPCALERRRDAITRQLQQQQIVRGEPAWGQRANVEHAECALHGVQRHCHKRPYPLGVQRTGDLNACQVANNPWLASGQDVSRDTFSDGDSDLLYNLLVEPVRGLHDQMRAV